MEHDDREAKKREMGGPRLSRRAFTAAALAGLGLAAGAGPERAGVSAPISMVEAAHYERLPRPDEAPA